MRAYTKNQDRTIRELQQIWDWVVATYGPPIIDLRWTYGKDRDGLLNGIYDIEWYEFYNEKDAVMFLLKWET
jgi:hypothetical protein